MTSSTIQRLSLAGLVGIVATYCFLANAAPALADFSNLEPASEGIFQNRGLYLVLSLLLASWGAIFPERMLVIVSILSLSICLSALLLAATLITFVLICFTLAIMIGLQPGTFPWLMKCSFISGGFVAPVAALITVVVVLVANTAKGLKQNKLLRQWEINVMLIAASWIGLAIGWRS